MSPDAFLSSSNQDRLLLKKQQQELRAAPVHRTTYECKLPLILVFLNKSGCNLWQLGLCGEAAIDKQLKTEKSRHKKPVCTASC